MKIKKLTLQNFRCFDKYEIQLSDRFTLLIGDNGAGKTAILDALAYSANKFLEGFPFYVNSEENEYSPKTDDIRFELKSLGQGLIKERLASALISTDGVIDGKPYSWSFSIKTTRILSIDDISQIRIIACKLFEEITHKQTILPIIAKYGTNRLWKTIRHKEVEILPPDSRLIGYRDCLNPDSNFEQLFRWFKTQELAALQKQEQRHVLEAVREAIINVIPDAQKVWWDIDWDELRVEILLKEIPHAIPFHLLSDGYRNMIAMAADIAYRMATLNPQLEADVIKQTEGIVLIDEIDLHLHPKWQRQVVDRLLNTFPKVQFIATSHSPFIIQSLYHRKDALVWDLEKAQPLAIESESIEDIAEDQQHVEIPQKSKRFLDMMEAAEAYYRKLHEVKNASDEEVMSLRARLDELTIPFSDDPSFAAQLKFERETLLGSKGE